MAPRLVMLLLLLSLWNGCKGETDSQFNQVYGQGSTGININVNPELGQLATQLVGELLGNVQSGRPLGFTGSSTRPRPTSSSGYYSKPRPLSSRPVYSAPSSVHHHDHQHSLLSYNVHQYCCFCAGSSCPEPGCKSVSKRQIGQNYQAGSSAININIVSNGEPILLLQDHNNDGIEEIDPIDLEEEEEMFLYPDYYGLRTAY